MRPTPVWLRDRSARIHDLAAGLVEHIGDDRHYPLRTATALVAGLGLLAALSLGAAEVLR